MFYFNFCHSSKVSFVNFYSFSILFNINENIAQVNYNLN